MNPDICGKKNSGSILIVAVWMLALLFLLTISLGRRVNQELLFVKYSLHKMQSRYLARAGFYYALEKVREDSQDEKSKLFDNAFACGVQLADGQKPENVFKGALSNKGRFEIATQRLDGESLKTYFGLSDEDGKLNLNALKLENYGIFKELLITVGVPEKEALRISQAVVDWLDEDSRPVSGNTNEEEGPFLSGKNRINVKNRPFDNPVELMFIEGMTQEIYQKIAGFITVFPRRTERIQINLSMAPKEVLLAVAQNLSGALTNSSLTDARSLIDKILVSRSGPDKIYGTMDDRAIDEKNLNLVAPEENIFRAMAPFSAGTSRFLNIQSTGFSPVKEHKSRIQAVVDRDTLAVVSWREN